MILVTQREAKYMHEGRGPLFVLYTADEDDSYFLSQ